MADEAPPPGNAEDTPRPGSALGGVLMGTDSPSSISAIGDVAGRVWDKVKEIGPSEIGKALVTGVHHAAQEGLQSADEGLRTLGKHAIPGLLSGSGIPPSPEMLGHQETPTEPSTITLPAPVEEPSTPVGKALVPLVQFATGMVGVGKVLGPLKGAGVAATIGYDAVRFGLVGTYFFDPMEARVANMVQEHPAMRNFVTDFLSAKPDDTLAEARLKSFLENAALGPPVDAALYGFKAMRAWRAGNKQEAVELARASEDAAAKAMQEPPKPAVPEVEAKPVDIPPPDPNAQVTTGVKAEEPRPDPARIPIFSKEESDAIFDDIVGNLRANEIDPFSRPDPSSSVVPLHLIDGSRTGEEILTAIGASVRTSMERLGINAPEKVAGWNSEADAVLRKMHGERGAERLMKAALQAVGDINEGRIVLLALSKFSAAATKKLKDMADLVAGGGVVDDAMAARISDLMSLAVGANSVEQLGLSAAGRFLRQAGEARQSGGGWLIENWIKGGHGQIGSLSKEEASHVLDLVAAMPRDGRAPESMRGLFWNFRNKAAGYYVQSVMGYTSVAAQIATDPFKALIIMPSKEVFAGLYRGEGLAGKYQEMVNVANYYVGIKRAVLDSMELSGRSVWEDTAQSMRQRQNVLDSHAVNRADEFGAFHEQPVSLVKMLEDGDFAGVISGAVTRAIGLPMRLAATEAEFVQQITYFGRVYADAAAEAAAGGLKGPAKDAHIQTRLSKAYDEAGRGVDEAGLDWSRQATLNMRLESKFMQGVQDVATNVPEVRFVLPFIRTPTNMLKDVRDYSGLRAFSDVATLRRDWEKGGAAAEAAVGRLGVAAGVATTLGSLAFNGKITGSGPIDPSERKELEASGWRAYSYVRDNPDGSKTYVPYDRLDPFGMISGIMADLVTVANNTDGREFNEIAPALVAMFAKDVTSRTYLQNVNTLLEAVTATGPDSDQRWSRLTASVAGGFIPSQLKRLDDTEDRLQLRGIVDRMLYSLPGYSANADRVYNTLGEKISANQNPGVGKLIHPFYSSRTDPDDNVQRILTEIARSNHEGFQPPDKVLKLPGSKGKGVDLTQIRPGGGRSLYDRYQSLIGETPDGQTLRGMIEGAVKVDPKLWNDPKNDGKGGYEGKRYTALMEIISKRREAARAYLMQESPELMAALLADQQNAANVLRYGTDAELIPVDGQRKRVK